MRAKSMVLLLVALGFGLVASIGVSEAMLKKDKTPVEEKVPIFVAATDINIGDKLDDKNVRTDEWPKNRIPEGAITRIEDIRDKYARSRCYPGEVIMPVKLMTSKADVTTNIPPGHRVVAANVTVDTVAGGLVRPGDRVDILGFFRKSGDVPETTMRKILENVRIFAVNTEVDRQVDQNGPKGGGCAVKTCSFLILEEQVELLMLAMEMGNLRLALRSPDDASKSSTNGEAKIQTLFGQGPQTADLTRSAPAPQAEPKKDFLDFLREKSSGEKTIPVSAPAAPTDSMIVLSPNGASTFHFHGNSPLPEVTTQPIGPAATSPGSPAKLSPRDDAPVEDGEDKSEAAGKPLTSAQADAR